MGKKVDVAVIGCGPAGLSAAVNVFSRKRSLLLIGPKLCSASLHKAHRINNYLGIPGVTGEELRRKFLEHVRGLGIHITQANVSAVYPMDGRFGVQFRNELIEAASVILTTGVLAAGTVQGEEELVGRGVSYCATCDALFYQGKRLVVSAQSSEHEEEACFLAEVAGKVYYLPGYEDVGQCFPANVEVLRDRITSLAKAGQDLAVSLSSGRELAVDGAFILKDQLPMSQLVAGLELDNKHVRVDSKMATSIPGLFAAGDVTGRPYQVAKAVGQGQQAALSAVAYLDGRLREGSEIVQV